MTVPRLRPQVQAARQRLAEGYDELRRRHQAGANGREISTAIAGLRDEVLLGLYRAAMEGLGQGEPSGAGARVALVAHGGYGRREAAPYSDVDLMVLRDPGTGTPAAALSERLLCDVFDAGLELGHSVRTVDEACRLAARDATICTSLVESRFLAGNRELFDRFAERFRRLARRRASALVAAVERARLEERIKHGETVHLLEPNVKKSRGGLRDAHLIRWIGQIRWGAREPEELVVRGVLTAEDARRLDAAVEFLLWIRNEVHFSAGKPGDVLSRGEQVRIAEVRGCRAAAGMLPVEQFMREYFRHTGEVSHLAARCLAKARSAPRWKRFWTTLFGRHVPGGLLAGPTEILATRQALRRLRGSLAAIMHLVELANLYDKQVAAETWEAIRREAPSLPARAPPEAHRHFLALLEHPGRLGELLRGLHEVGLLERFIPEFAHARGLLQFNQYHKFTVDEHCIRAVERAVEMLADRGPLGRVYRAIAEKRVLHLALLIHDLGKGFPEDHSEVGRRIAQETARRLGLGDEEGDHLEFLVSKHLLMNHVALRRDTSDEHTIVRFAADVGSPERLQMLFVFTAADLGAVGPDAWTGWKAEVLADLFHRAMQHLAGESPGTSREEYLEGRRQAVRELLGPGQVAPKLAAQVEALPAAYLTTTDPAQIADDLRLLAALAPGEVNAQGRYQRESGTVRFTVGTSEDVAPGIFHRLTGALTGHGLEILSAQIYTLAEGMVLDRFWVYDRDYAGEPPPHRLDEIRRSLVDSLVSDDKRPTFRRVWQVGGSGRLAVVAAQTRVHIDNHTSDRYTIIDVVTLDRRGLLYAITRTLFELGYSVWRAKIGTYLDQVVDVFYVTDPSGAKVESPLHLQETRRRLLEVIERPEE